MLEERKNQTDVFHHYVVSAVCHYFAVDWYLLVGKIGAWYLIPFLLCLLLLYPIVFSTLIDICKEDKADSLVYLIKRNIWLLSKRQGVSVVFMPFVWTVLVYTA